ncbi:MAG: flavodoxin family protein [Oscillospiraceae bacterium]|nr:flavodoxin family protein [Oscillospiraceae bacterium]
MVLAINGSPRKSWNTHMLLEKTLEGAASNGAETEIINLYELDYKGCYSCFGCKRQDGLNGRCVVNDDARLVLDKIEECDAFILGSPIYIGEVSGMMRAFYERLIFQYISYDNDSPPLFNMKIKTAFIFTTNASASAYEQTGYTAMFQRYENMLARIFGECRTLAVGETLQTDDYSKYHMSRFDEQERRRIRNEIFPLECEKAIELGIWASELF